MKTRGTRTAPIRQRPPLSTLLVTAAVSAATFIAACGPAQPANGPPPSPAPGPVTTPTSEPTAEPTSSPAPAPAPKAVNVPIGATKLAAKVAEIGIDLSKAPVFDKVDIEKKKAIMPLFVEALGFEDCTGCHVATDKDFDKDTHHTRLAKGMWDNFVLGLRDNDGGAIFCDTCHGGKHHLLDRKDTEALTKFMGDEYEGKLTRADGAEHSCSTCHTDVFEGKVFKDVWGIEE